MHKEKSPLHTLHVTSYEPFYDGNDINWQREWNWKNCLLPEFSEKMTSIDYPVEFRFLFFFIVYSANLKRIMMI